MENKAFNLKVVTQIGNIYEGITNKLVVTTKSGDLTILPEHANLISLLDVGVIEVHDLSKGLDHNLRFIINGGLVSVHNNNVLVLVDEGILSEQLAEKEINEALEKAKQVNNDIEIEKFEYLERNLKYAILKKNIYEKNKGTIWKK
jgi:F-type H+-transporting ATPase subunit epsilon